MRKKCLLIGTMSCIFLAGCGNVKLDVNDVNAAGIVTESIVTAQPEEGTKTVMPLPAIFAEKAGDEMPDGDYSVSFATDDLQKTDKGYQIKMNFYDYDRYQKEEIDSLNHGDAIQVAGKEVAVDRISWNKDNKGKVIGVDINGGINEDGLSLRLEESVYCTTSLDDYPLYYSIGTGTLQVSKDIVLQDCYDYETLPEGIVTGYKDLPESITKSGSEYWTQSNTAITVRNNEIVKIVRRWTLQMKGM